MLRALNLNTRENIAKKYKQRRKDAGKASFG